MGKYNAYVLRRHPIAPDIVSLHGPSSAQRLHPPGDGLPDLVRRIFLQEMEPRDRHLGLRWQTAREFEIRAAGEEQTGLGLHKQLGHIARCQPVRMAGW